MNIYRDGIFEGQTALITGGGTGIGFGIAQCLGSLGAKVIIAARTVDRLEQAKEKLRGQGIQAYHYEVNIRDEGLVEQLFEQVQKEHGLPDILVNNAGGQFTAHSVDLSPNGFRSVVDLNLNGTWLMSSAYGRRLISQQQPGTIVNIVVVLKSGVPGMIHAGAARSGVVNMTKTLAYEWAPHQIRVNAIAPGSIETSGIEQYGHEFTLAYVQKIPQKRLGSVEEVAQAVAYLCSPAAGFITGTTLELDGGEHLVGALMQL